MVTHSSILTSYRSTALYNAASLPIGTLLYHTLQRIKFTIVPFLHIPLRELLGYVAAAQTLILN